MRCDVDVSNAALSFSTVPVPSHRPRQSITFLGRELDDEGDDEGWITDECFSPFSVSSGSSSSM